MKKALFIDFDGTICFDRFWMGIPDLVMVWINQNVFGNSPLISDWMKGFKTSEQINRYIAHGTRYDYDKLWSLFVSKCENMFVDPDVLNQIKFLSDRYTTVLITDNMDCFTRFTVPVLKLDTFFDVIASSSDYGVLKNDPDATFFKTIAEKHDIDLSRSYLIDNSRNTCELFERFGERSFITNSLQDTKDILNRLKKT